MKRIFMVLLGCFLLGTLAMAQITGFNQYGNATQELAAHGFAIGHPSLPLNTRATIVNTLTGETIEVTVIRHIAASPHYIADLSPAAWQALGLHYDTTIRISTNVPVRPGYVITPPLPVAELPPAPAAPPAEPVHVTPVVLLVQPAPVKPVPEEPAAVVQEEIFIVAPVFISVAADPAHLPEERHAPVVAADTPYQALPVSGDPDLFTRLMDLIAARQEAQTPQPAVVVNVNPQLSQNVNVQGTAQGTAQPGNMVVYHSPPRQEEPAAANLEIMTRLLALEARQQARQREREAAQPAPPAVDPELMARLLVIEAMHQARIQEREAALAVQPVPVPEPAPLAIDPELMARLLAIETLLQARIQEREAAQIAQPAPEPAPPAIDPEFMARLLALEAMHEARARKTPEPAVQPVVQFILQKAPAPHVVEVPAPPAIIPPAPQIAAPPIPQPVTPPFPGLAPIAPEIMAALYDPEIMALLEILEAREAARQPPIMPPAPLPDPQVMPPAPLPGPHIVHPQPALADHIQPVVSPALPDPNSGRLYRLQVGAFTTMDAANRISQLLVSAGFSVVQEHNGSAYRVLAVNVPAAMVYPAVQRLGVMGISQVLVRN